MTLDTPSALSELTLAIKAFQRPECVERLLRSLVDRGLGAVPTLVLDDGDRPATVPPGSCASIVATDFDVGLSAGRNQLVRMAKTEFIAILDDDWVVTEETDIGLLLGLVAGGMCDIAGCAIRESGGYWNGGWVYLPSPGGMRKIAACRYSAEVELGGRTVLVQYVDQINNFFVARVGALQQVRWDEKLKLNEHNDFFLRASRSLRVAYTPATEACHQPEAPDGYARYRDRKAEFARHFHEKWGFERVEKQSEWFLHAAERPVLPSLRADLILG
jgi:hypothetical protein